jgi:DMSO/TMAO reductase YedYZ heme-binding membrane subunit
MATVSSQLWWWLARASGLVAWAATAAAVIWGLALSSKIVRRRRIPAWLLDLHRYLGTLTLVFVGVHLAALAADSYTFFGFRELFVPMASQWKPAAVLWGIVAFYLMLLVMVTSWMMRRLPRKLWHSIHLLSFAIFASGTVHGVLAGTDGQRTSVQVAALAVMAVMLFLVLFRLFGAWGVIAEEITKRTPPKSTVVMQVPPTAPEPSGEATAPQPLDPALAERLARLGSRARARS